MSPFEHHIPAILNAPISFLEAPTGTGKSTLFPLELEKHCAGQIILVQPRRAAARLLAYRMAQLHNEPVGQTVGYHIRHEHIENASTQILVVTVGILLRRLQSDPFLDNVDIVILDEFHERSAQLDLLLIFLNDLQSAREELRLILTSATLDIAALEAFFPQAHHAKIEAQHYPIQVSYLPTASPKSPPELAAQCMRRLLKEDISGHILIFMPGLMEINLCMQLLTPLTEFPIFPLHSRLNLTDTQKALQPSDRPKIIVSTNIAESSVTIPNVRYVIDSGLERIAIAADIGSSLITQHITLASAKQRAGRAGRTAEGYVYRLWTKAAEKQFRAHREPEITRIDLLSPLLQIYQWGAQPKDCLWLTAPSHGQQSKAKSELERLKLIQNNRITPLGSSAAELPLSPRMAIFLLSSNEAQFHHTACALVTFISEGDPWPQDHHADVWSKILRIQKEGPSRRRDIHKVYHQLVDILPSNRQRTDIDIEAACIRLFLEIFPERLGYRLGLGNIKLASGQKGRIAEGAGRETPYFMAISISQKDDAPPFVHQYHPIEVDWIPAQTVIKHSYNTEFEQVVAQEEKRIGALIIHSRPCSVDIAQASNLLCQAAQAEPERFLPLDSECLTWLMRLRYWVNHHDSDIDTFEDWRPYLQEWCVGKSRRSELLSIPILSEIKARVPWHIQQSLQKEVPDFFMLPSGAKAQIHYETNMPPQFSARIQQLFGLQSSPKILNIPVQITLLAPNQRPQQQTQDMASFWKNTYPQLRKELRGRYPKHAWPENPSIADAENRPSRKNHS